MRKVNWLIIACVLASVFLWFGESDTLVEYFAFSRGNLLAGRLWTLVTALFLHSDISHLLGNMLFLFVFGNTLEKELDATRTLTVFFFGGTVSFLFSSFFYNPNTYLIGASAAIFTLTSIVMLIKPLKFSFLLFMPQGLAAIIYFIYNAVAVYVGVQGNVAYISHVVGFILGVPFGIAWSEKWLRNILITFGLFFIYLLVVFLLIPSIINFAI